MLDINNTQTAFSSKNNAELRKSYWLFQLISHPWLVGVGGFFLRIAMKLHLPVEPIIRQTIFWQFCGGESIAACRPVIAKLHQHRIGTILDYSVEGREQEQGLEETKQELLRTIQEARGNPSIPFTVFKVTGIARFGLLEKPDGSEEWKRAVRRLREIGLAAKAANVRVLIDAEESWIQDTIDSLVQDLMAELNTEKAVVFNTAQMYRHDRLAYLGRALAHAREKDYFLGLKIVRGAYLEKERDRAAAKGYPSPLYPDKAATDQGYDDALRLCIQNLDRITLCAGTHNDRSTLLLAELMKAGGIAKWDPRVWSAQLLGMSDHLSYNLAAEGFNVAKYVPYGPVREMVPYLMRRARENTSIQGQTSRELRLLKLELGRRRSS